jgi:hypothetical protein
MFNVFKPRSRMTGISLQYSAWALLEGLSFVLLSFTFAEKKKSSAKGKAKKKSR